ncbi:hypothetical protein FNV43_RR25152 [Rhamnella rubrinervis]|uniref:Nodulin-like domain-containing protein n=1 Tax=Rhamnella rubrinervis TaxID=2594499 RepID=A0A8K0GPU1_9ROSA|nr:hypothetical protein FNV43_RR25152 [Rhamnella rubrinervis]
MGLLNNKNGGSSSSPTSTIGIHSFADLKSLTHQVLAGRWLMVFASFLMMATTGASYMFGLYSNDIKSVLGYDQTTLNLISFFKDLGANIGIFSGLINEITPPWVVLFVGAAFNFSGYFMIWLSLTQKIPKPQVWQMCLYITIGANSHTFINTGALVTCVKNFRNNGRGILIGLLNGYIGISAALISQLYRAFFGVDDTKSFTLFVALLPSALALCFLRLIRIVNVNDVQNNNNNNNKEQKVLYNFFYISLFLAGFLLVMIIVQSKVTFTKKEYGGSAAVLIFLLFLPFSIVVTEEYDLWKKKKKKKKETTTDDLPTPIIDNNNLIITTANSSFPGEPVSEKRVSCWKNVFRPPEIGDDYTILQAIFSVEMITLLVTTICGLGGTLTLMDNLGQIGTSLGYSLQSITTFVSLTSVWIYLGEACVGILSEIFITKYKFPRPLMFTMTLLFSCIGHLLIAFNVKHGLYAASIITGFCFGAHWPLIFSIISEIFGLKHYSTLYNFGSMASPIGLYLLNVRVTGYLYDKEAMKQLEALGLKREAGKELNCNGGECFKLAFIIITGVTLLGTLVSLVLVWRTRKFYKGDIYRKFRDESNVVASELEINKALRPVPETEDPDKDLHCNYLNQL